MDPVQTTVENAPARAIAGMWGDGPSRYRESFTRFAETALNPGLVVIKGTGAQQVKKPSATTDLDANALSAVNAGAGVLLHEHRGTAGAAALFEANDAVNVVRKGPVWMITETALAAGARPFVRCVAAGAEVAGALRNDADTADAVQVSWLVVREAVSEAGLVLVEVVLPLGGVGDDGPAGPTGPTGPAGP